MLPFLYFLLQIFLLLSVVDSSILLSRYLQNTNFIKANNETPIWPPYFSTNWTIYATTVQDPSPPYRYTPPAPFRAGRGKTFYDWGTKSMIEIYEDFCIPIFDVPEKMNFTCNFLNTNNTVYLIATENVYVPDCCIFGQPWEPAAPDFANHLLYNKTIELCDDDEIIDFYIKTMWDNDTDYDPFGYGFSRNWTTDGTNSWRKGARFFFLGYEGWISQFFYDFEAQKPDPSVFEIPDICKNAQPCYFLEPMPNTTSETITDPTTMTSETITDPTTMTSETMTNPTTMTSETITNPTTITNSISSSNHINFMLIFVLLFLKSLFRVRAF